MSQNLDKNKICDSIQKSKPQDLLYLTINPVEKNSKKNSFLEIEKFIKISACSVLICRIKK